MKWRLAGIKIDKKPALFELCETSTYKVLGMGYPYNGPVYAYDKSVGEVVVGVCENGIRSLYADGGSKKHVSGNDA